MANKNKNTVSEEQESKKSSSSKKSSKLNTRSKTVLKPDPNDSISMSQELMIHMKKKVENRKNRTKRPSKTCKNRMLPNKKCMPTLADLEKMFDDSDDDTDSKNAPKTDDKVSLTNNENEINNIETLLVPAMDSIIKQAKEILNNWSNTHQNDPIIQSPSRKRLKSNVSENDEDFDNLPPVETTSKRTKYDISLTNQEIETHHNSLVSSPTKDLENDKTNNVNFSINSTVDSNKITSTFKNNISKSFSPLPSTSKDNAIFTKNDELFLERLKEFSDKQKDLPVGMTTIPSFNAIETITTNDEIKNKEPQEEIQKSNEDEIEVVDSMSQNDLSNLKKAATEKYNDDDDDDDCVIVESNIETIDVDKHVSREPEVIDLEYDFVNTAAHDFEISSNWNNLNDTVEIIDVDTLIDRNESILRKYKTSDDKQLDTANQVSEVEVIEIEKPNIISTNNRDSRGEINVAKNQSQETIANVESTTKQKSNVHTFTECDVLKFFNNIYNGGSVLNENTLPPLSQNLLNTIRGIKFASNFVQNPVPSIPERTSNISTNLNTTPGTPMTQNTQTSLSNSHIIQNALALYHIIDSAIPTFQTTITDSSEILQNTTAAAHGTQPIPPMLQSMLPDSIIFPSTSTHNSSTTQTNQRTKKGRKKGKSKKGKSTCIIPKSPTPPVSPEQSGIGDCPICLEKLSKNVIVSTMCGHVFCLTCLERVIETTKRCPTCRKIIKKRGYHKIFL